jgi:hypothetical protein
MAGPRRRTWIYALAALALVWGLAMAGYELAKSTKLTPEQVAAYARSLDLSKLSPAEREKVLHRLADYLNTLSLDERRAMQPNRELFDQMTDEEKEWFIEATMPTEIKLALSQFESLPQDQRQKVIDNTLKNLRAQDAQGQADGGAAQPSQLSPELEAKVRSLGLKTFYSDSSAETKAELAPVLNELQLQMENGRGFRRGPPDPGPGG